MQVSVCHQQLEEEEQTSSNEKTALEKMVAEYKGLTMDLLADRQGVEATSAEQTARRDCSQVAPPCSIVAKLRTFAH
jgi:hypothetical protein